MFSGCMLYSIYDINNLKVSGENWPAVYLILQIVNMTFNYANSLLVYGSMIVLEEYFDSIM